MPKPTTLRGGEDPVSNYPEDAHLTALHEAGHVVVCYAVGSVIRETTVEPEDPDIGGCAPCKHRWGGWSAVPVVAQAGLAAEMLYGPDPQPDATFKEAVHSPIGGYSVSDVSNLIDFLCEPQTSDGGVEHPPYCSRAVAKKVIPEAYSAVRDFLADWEPVVRKIADRLLSDGSLRPSQLYPLLPQELRERCSLRGDFRRAWDRALEEEGERQHAAAR